MKHVCILNGVHRGAVVGVGENPILIGGEDGCDALLSDESAAGSAIQVSLNPDDRLVVSRACGVATRNGRPLREGKQMPLPPGAVIGIGDVELAVGDDLAIAGQAVSKRNDRRMMANLGGLSLVCLAVFGVIGVFGGPADAYNPTRNAHEAGFVEDRMNGRRDPVVALEREIARNGFSDSILVTRDADSKIMATGSITNEDRKRWQAITRWFDGRFGDVAMLESQVSGRSDDIVLPFRIVSIRSAPNPQVVTQNGQTFPLGSFLPGEWEVREIEGMTVVLVRRDQELSISF